MFFLPDRSRWVSLRQAPKFVNRADQAEVPTVKEDKEGWIIVI